MPRVRGRPAATAGSSLRPTRKYSVIAAILVLCVALDQWTKVLAEQYLQGQPVRRYLGDTVRLLYLENKGAFLSLGAGLSEGVRHWVFVVGVAVVVFALLFMLIRESRLNTLEVVAFSLVIAGGIGNLIDRISFGVVRDFMNMGIGSLRTGVFNVADMAITAGAVFILFDLVRKRGKDRPAPDGAEEVQDAG